MTCPTCHHDNPAGARFCSMCGCALAPRCPSCGAEAAVGARFCGACGTALAGSPSPGGDAAPPSATGGPVAPAPRPPAPRTSPAAPSASAPTASAAELRQLTVLFCDLVGSTALSEQLDPEALRDVLRDYQSVAGRVVARYEGHLAKYLGDGLLAYFGYPTAHEDDAQRAVRAGLAILEGLDPLRERMLREHGAELHARIGIHTGPVVAGDMGADDAHESKAVVGRTPNLAARLQERAAHDTVIISADTFRLVQGYFETVPLGSHALKGIAEPVDLFHVRSESGARNRLEAAAAGERTPMVGREPEIGLLAGRWDAVLDGQGQAVLVVGEAGIGKSRIVQAIKEVVAADPSAWLTECFCSPYHTQSALYPVIDLFTRVIFGFGRGDDAAVRLTKIEGFIAQYGLAPEPNVPLLADLLSVGYDGRYPPLAVAPERHKQLTLQLMVDLLLRRAAVQPLLLVHEDLHWADPTTLEMLEMLVGAAADARIMLLMTSRPGHDIAVARRSEVAQLTLSRLSDGQTSRVAARISGGLELPAEVMAQIVAKTDGVPLYIEELTKMVIEAGLVVEKGGRYVAVGPIGALAIPATLQDSLVARLDRLSTEKLIAQVGATIGRDFSYDVIAAAAPCDTPTLHAGLERLVGAQLVFQRGTPPDARYVFKHALVQDAAYGSMLTGVRRQHHARIADAYIERFPEVAETQPELVAHHLTEAGDPVHAMSYWQQAGMRALARAAAREAVAHLNKALEELAKWPAGTEHTAHDLALNAALGQAYLIFEGYSSPNVERHLSIARDLCEQLGHPPVTGPVTWGLWACYLVRGDYARTRTLSDEFRAACERVGDDDGLVEAYMMSGIDRYYVGEAEGASEFFERCAEAYDPARHSGRILEYGNDSGMAGRAYHSLLLWWQGRPIEALRVCEEGLAMARAVGHPYMIGFNLTFAARLHQMRHDLPSLFAAADECIAIAVERGFPIWEGYCRIVRGWARVVQGDADEGLAELGAGVDIWRAIGARLWLPYFLGLLADACRLAGRFDDGLAAVAEAQAVAAATGERIDDARLLELRGALRVAKGGGEGDVDGGEIAAGEVDLRDALAMAQAMGAVSWGLQAARSLAGHLGATGRGGEGAAVLGAALGAYGEGGDEVDQVGGRAELGVLVGVEAG
ncbi:MAG: AAA family ATPase [Ardenticatenales bacterium]|nr:AAA family ATPase [Ardenticatenales bacterium]